MTKEKFFAVLVLMLVALSFVHSGGRPEATAATDAGVVNVYANPQEDWVAAAMAQFTRDTGIQVNYVRLGSGETYARVRAEAANPRTDVWWGGTLDPHVQAKTDGFLERYISPMAVDIPAEFLDPDGYWHGMYAGILGFTINEALLRQMNLPIPRTWQDLIDPQYKDLIAMSDPQTSGTAYTIMASLVQLMGEDEAYDYMAKLHQNIVEYTRSGPGPIQVVALGEAAIGLNFAHDTIKFMLEGMPVSVVVPEDGTGYEIGGLTILKGAPNFENAKKLVDWTLSPAAQELAATTGAFQLPTNLNARVPDEAIPLSAVKVVDYDFAWAGANRDRLIQRWIREIGDR